MSALNKVYEYKKKLPLTPHWRGTQETHIADAEKDYVLGFISIEEFGELFGGYLKCFENPETTETPNFIGVWGKDKTAKFKRILQERGAKFEICKIDGEQRRISITSQTRLPGALHE